MQETSSGTPCPDCKQPSGYPFLTTTTKDRPGIVRVLMRCGTCEHHWVVEHNADSGQEPIDPRR